MFLTPHIKVFHMVFFSISACHFKLSDMNCWMVLLCSPGFILISTRCHKRLKRTVENAAWGMDVFRSCNLLTHFHQAQWHSLCIRLSEHCQEKEKGNLKSNKNYTILLVYLKQTNATFLSSPRSSCRSSIH